LGVTGAPTGAKDGLGDAYVPSLQVRM